MTPKQAIVYKIIDEWWRMYGFAPSIDDVMKHTGDRGRANIHRIYKLLCAHGHCRMTPRKARSIRPVSLRMRDID
jgi:SOS-response transcriptional repressor LexA